MAQKFLTNIDLNQNELVNAKFEFWAIDPTSGNFEGRTIYNTAEDVIKVWSGTAWRTLLASTGQTGGAANAVVSGGPNATALTINESNGQITITPELATSSIAGLLTAADFTKLGDATAEATADKLIIRDASGRAKVATPTLDAHIATKAYVDAARQGLDVKQSVRVATTAAVDLTADLQAGDEIDGVELVAGDRVLVKNQIGGAAAENGIYVAVASGTALRSSDANGTVDTGELKPGTFTFVEEGSVNSDKGFVVSTNGTITIDSTGIAWTQFSGAGSFTAGDGISQNGNTINVNVTANRTQITSDAIDIHADYVGQTSITTLGTIATGTWAATDVAVEHGGTGSSTAADARLALGIKTSAGAVTTDPSVLARVAHQPCAASSGTTSVTTVTHKFNTKNVLVQVYQVSTGETVNCDVVRSSLDAVVVTINGSLIGLDDFHIVVTG
jgi:hypothetical protein